MSIEERISDSLSLIASILGKMVAATHPIKFFLGLLTGVILANLSPFLLAMYPQLRIAHGLGAVSNLGFYALGLLAWLLPTVLQKEQLSEENESYISLIETLVKKGNFSEVEERQFYRRMTEKALEAFNPKEGTSVGVEDALKEMRQAAETNEP